MIYNVTATEHFAPLPGISRVNLIDHRKNRRDRGVALSKTSETRDVAVEIAVQDNGRTLKIRMIDRQEPGPLLTKIKDVIADAVTDFAFMDGWSANEMTDHVIEKLTENNLIIFDMEAGS